MAYPRFSVFHLGLLVFIPFLFFSWHWSYLEELGYLSIRRQSINSLQELLSNGTLTSAELVRIYLRRTAEVNPTVHAVAEINAEAMAIAQALDEERRVSGPRGPLHGIPVLLKDSISAHGMNNTAGSYCLVGAESLKESSVVSRLRAAGAIILGKANMSQWGNSRSSSKTTSNGWSSWGGQTVGVYHPDQDPCGSSSGSAVSMALDLAAATVGVETVGSITCPAGRNGMVSIKPTSGLVSRDNVIVTKLRGSVGPITKSVRDAAIMLGALSGKSPEDAATNKIPFDTIPDYEKSCKLGSLHSSRLAVPRNALDNPFVRDMNLTAVMDTFENVIKLLRDNGAIVVDPANYSDYAEVNTVAPQQRVGPAEYKFDMAQYFSGLKVNPHNLHGIEDMISCTKTHHKEEYPSRDIANWDIVKGAEDLSSPQIIAAIDRMKYLGGPGGIDGALDKADADALIIPSIACADVPALVGYPVVTVPMGFLPPDTPITRNERGNLVEEGPGIPYGLSFISRPFSEQRLIELAYAFEQLTDTASQQQPIILPKTDIPQTLQAHHQVFYYFPTWLVSVLKF